jgi:flavorubredoxin
MKPRKIAENVSWLGALDWNRRLFDALIPLPDGTSYNAYLVQGSEKTALLDTVDPATTDVLMAQLADTPRLDLVISHHAEQDHSGALPAVLEKYPDARLLCTTKAKGMLMDLLGLPEARITPVEDGETLSLGDKTLKFIYTPWVHWPETMVTYLKEDRFLFSCDFFGSHLATTDLYADEARIYEPAKRYYAEIMMPFHGAIKGNLDKLKDYAIDLIAPSHGPLYRRAAFIMDAYREWVAAAPKNIVVLPYASMHGSTEKMVEHLIGALVEQGVTVQPFNLSVTDIGKLAMALVDAATIVVGTPTVMVHPHPTVIYAAYLANALRPKARFVSMVGSYGWGTKAAETLTGMLPNLKAEILDPVICKGFPREQDFAALDGLARTIAAKHRENNFT